MNLSVVDLGLAEQLGQAPGADAAPDLHLPHALGGMDPALGEEQVVGGRGVDLRDAVDVADDVTSAPRPGMACDP